MKLTISGVTCEEGSIIYHPQVLRLVRGLLVRRTRSASDQEKPPSCGSYPRSSGIYCSLPSRPGIAARKSDGLAVFLPCLQSQFDPRAVLSTSSR